MLFRSMEEARAVGAALNVWDVQPALVAERTAEPDGLEVTWAGPSPSASPPIVDRLGALHGAGASWAVFAWPVDVEELAAAARDVGEARGSGGAATGS